MEFEFYTLRELFDIFNTVTDDFIDETEIITCLNFGIAKVNSYCKTSFPRIKTSTGLEDEYTYIPDTYMDLLVIEWARWRYKHKEEDINGAISFQNTMREPMSEFYNDYVLQGYAEGFRKNKDYFPITNVDNDFLGW